MIQAMRSSLKNINIILSFLGLGLLLLLGICLLSLQVFILLCKTQSIELLSNQIILSLKYSTEFYFSFSLFLSFG
jgi:hypothetical protein